MKRFGTESPPGLHYTNRYGSPDHLMGRSLNRQCIESTTSTNLNLLLPSSDRTNEFEIAATRNYAHINTHTHRYTCTHTHIYIQVYTFINLYTYLYIYINI